MPIDRQLIYDDCYRPSPRQYHFLLPPPVLVALAPKSVTLSFLEDADGADAASSSGSKSNPSSLCRSSAASRDPLLAVNVSDEPPLPPKLPLELLMDETPAALRQIAALIASTSRANLPAAF
ncbi:hypothetical protein ACI65C_004316 [Semiaphis heraclei]